MRVLQVTTSSERRGAEVFAEQLGAALGAAGHDVRTVALHRGGAPSLPFDVLGSGRRDPRTHVRLAVLARQHDVLVAHGGSTLVPVAAAAAASGRAFVYRNIGDPSHWGAVRGAGWRIGVPLRRAAAVVALYDEAARYLVGRYRLEDARVTVAGNAVESSRFPRADAAGRRAARATFGVDTEGPVLGYLGALSPEKRPELALDTRDALGDGTLLVAGDGPDRASLERRAIRSGGRVVLLGTVEDPAAFLAAVDVLLLPSRTEGIPGALLEAALVGTPVVAADVGGVGEVVRTTGGGRLVRDPEPSSLAAAVREVLDRPEDHVADRAEVERRFGMDAVASVWDRTLRAVAGPGYPPGTAVAAGFDGSRGGGLGD